MCVLAFFLNFFIWKQNYVDEFVTGFRNPDWVRTHLATALTALAILAVLRGAKMCRKTVMAEMAYKLILSVTTQGKR